MRSCSAIAASVIRRRVAAMSSPRFLSSYLRLICVSRILTDRLGIPTFHDSLLCYERKNPMSTTTPTQVLESIVTGINSGDLDSLLPLYESEAAFATEPGSLTPGIGEALNGFIAMNGTLDLEVTRVLEVDDLALVIGVW